MGRVRENSHTRLVRTAAAAAVGVLALAALTTGCKVERVGGAEPTAAGQPGTRPTDDAKPSGPASPSATASRTPTAR